MSDVHKQSQDYIQVHEGSESPVGTYSEGRQALLQKSHAARTRGLSGINNSTLVKSDMSKSMKFDPTVTLGRRSTLMKQTAADVITASGDAETREIEEELPDGEFKFIEEPDRDGMTPFSRDYFNTLNQQIALMSPAAIR